MNRQATGPGVSLARRERIALDGIRFCLEKTGKECAPYRKPRGFTVKLQ